VTFDDSRWRGLASGSPGWLLNVADQFAILEQLRPRVFPQLRYGPVYCATDYSGQHAGADFEVISLLLVSGNSVRAADMHRQLIRQKFLRDRRRMCFKELRDARRSAALAPYLDWAGSLDGILVNVATEKSLGPLFTRDLDFRFLQPVLRGSWDPTSFEHASRVAVMVALLAAGLTDPAKGIHWISDEDAIFANSTRWTDMTVLAGTLCEWLARPERGHLFPMTTVGDDVTQLYEDLCAVPDLAAGTTSEFMSSYCDELQGGGGGKMHLADVSASRMSSKAARIQEWLCEASPQLRKVSLAFLESKVGLFDYKMWSADAIAATHSVWTPNLSFSTRGI
jgi:hypothetical protein